MRIQVVIAVEDAMEAHRTVQKARPLWRRSIQWWPYTMALIIFLIILGNRLWTGENRPVLWWLAIFALIFLLASYFAPSRAKTVIKRAFVKDPTLTQPTEIEIREEALTWTSSLSQGQVQWDYFESYLETRGLFLLFHSGQSVRILPKRSFASESDLEAARNLFDTKIRAIYPDKRESRDERR